MLDLRKSLTTVDSVLTKAGIDHALIGGFALAVYGVNRATIDIDFLADGSHRDEIIQLLNASGFVLNFSTPEVLQFAGLGFVDVLLANRPLSLQMLKEAIVSSDLTVRVVRAEDLIGLKIQAIVNDPTREHQDKADIQSLLALQPALDWSRIKKYADLFSFGDEIERLKPK